MKRNLCSINCIKHEYKKHTNNAQKSVSSFLARFKFSAGLSSGFWLVHSKTLLFQSSGFMLGFSHVVVVLQISLQHDVAMQCLTHSAGITPNIRF